ncbi:MAG TPA: hypothetical protein VGD68_15750 [Streptosporangiaceae bacterium]
MSSTILYVAIVVIWIGVLVPRWLRHDGAHPGQSDLRRFSRHFGGAPPAGAPPAGAPLAGEAEDRAGFDPDGRPRYTSFVPSEPGAQIPVSRLKSSPVHGEQVSPPVSGNQESMAQRHEADTPRSPVQSYGWSAEEVTQQEHLSTSGPDAASARAEAPARREADAEPDAPGDLDAPPARDQRPRAPRGRDDAGSRKQIMRGRRRMLWLLLVLTAVGAGLAYLQLAASWVMIPPIVMLSGYLLLLREAAHADAEARERRELARATARAHRASDARGRARATAAGAVPAYETGPRADIIDLPERVEDQLYDQYTDAKLRAVGD